MRQPELPGGTRVCKPDSDSNIQVPPRPDHAGAAYMELQMYPPGYALAISCDQEHWCAALTIDSLQAQYGALHGPRSPPDAKANPNCVEPINFAYLTHKGRPIGPPGPDQQTNATFTPTRDVLQMNPGDALTVSMHDTPVGFFARITDDTTHQSGFMVASVRNGFRHIVWDPEHFVPDAELLQLAPHRLGCDVPDRPLRDRPTADRGGQQRRRPHLRAPHRQWLHYPAARSGLLSVVPPAETAVDRGLRLGAHQRHAGQISNFGGEAGRLGAARADRLQLRQALPQLRQDDRQSVSVGRGVGRRAPGRRSPRGHGRGRRQRAADAVAASSDKADRESRCARAGPLPDPQEEATTGIEPV